MKYLRMFSLAILLPACATSSGDLRIERAIEAYMAKDAPGQLLEAGFELDDNGILQTALSVAQ